MQKLMLRPSEVADALGVSRVTLWRMERRGEFPARRRIGSNSVGWTRQEVEEWCEKRPRIAREEPAT